MWYGVQSLCLKFLPQTMILNYGNQLLTSLKSKKEGFYLKPCYRASKMDKIKKALQKLTPKERKWVKEILRQLDAGQKMNLDIKKLKGRDDIFRVRKGDIRIIYRVDANGKLFILTIEKRKENTYKF